MHADPSASELLRRMVGELRKNREIPSTPLRLRERSVDDSVDHIRSDARFDRAQVMPHNRDALLAAMTHAPPWPGLVAEFGVHGGASLRLLAEAFPDQVVHGFDSFRGLPERWTGSNEQPGAFDVGGRPPDLPVTNVEFHVGWFTATVPAFAAATEQKLRFVHFDADLYSSTRTVFDHLGDRCVPGTVLVFDEYFGYHGWRWHEHKAFEEFLERSGLTFEALVIGHMNLGIRLLAA